MTTALRALLTVVILHHAGAFAPAPARTGALQLARNLPLRLRPGSCALHARRRRSIAPRGIIGKMFNNKIVKEVEKDEAEELRNQVMDNAGQVAIDKFDGPLSRLATELANRVDDTVLESLNKGSSLVEKAAAPLQGAVVQLQTTDPSTLMSAQSKNLDQILLSQDLSSQLMLTVPLHITDVITVMVGGWQTAAGVVY